jgi:hypothetical protein
MSDNILGIGGGFPGYSTSTTEAAAIVMRQKSKIIKRVTQGEGVIGFMTSYELQMHAYNQYGNGGGYRDGYCFIAPMLQESYNDKKPVYWTQDNSWPVGTLSGVQIIPGSAARPAWHLPPLPMPVNACGFVHSNLTRETVQRYAPYGFDMRIAAVGGLSIGYKVRRDPDTKEFFIVSNSTPGGHVLSYMYRDVARLIPQPVDPSPFYYGVAVVALQSDDDIPIDLTPQMWHLYHEKHINATITPAHGTELGDGTYVFIVATPIGDRVLTEFTVQGVDHLEDGTEVFTDLPLIYPDPADIPDGYKDGQARYYYGPVHSDVYVTAVAEGIEIEDTIKAGIPQTIQMTSDECLMEEGSWALGDTNLPANVELSISDLGLISFYVPQDVYDGNPGGTYYLNVTFTGYSQVKALTLLITLEDSPAFGTVWEPLYTFPKTVVGITKASSGKWYITTTDKIYKSTDLETFDECPLVGTLDIGFSKVVEVGGQMVTSDRGAIWITDGLTDTFTRQNTWTIPSGLPVAAGVGGDTSLNLLWHTCQRVGGDTLVLLRDSLSGAEITQLRVNVGIHGLSPVPPKLLSNGNWFLSLPSSTGYKGYIYNGATFELVVSGSQNIVCLNPFVVDSRGRITLIGVNSVDVFFSRYSDDNGATWSDEVVLTAVTPEAICSLKPNYLLVSQNTFVGRSSNSLATLSKITPALNGSIKCFELDDREKFILAGTTGTTHNLYISRS